MIFFGRKINRIWRNNNTILGYAVLEKQQSYIVSIWIYRSETINFKKFYINVSLKT